MRDQLRRAAAALREEARLIFENNSVNGQSVDAIEDCWGPNTEDEQLRYQEYIELSRLLDRPALIFCILPLLVSGQCGRDQNGNTYIFIDEEQSPNEQSIALWHETLHLLGLRDEMLVEEIALRLHNEAPEVLDLVKAAQAV